MKNNNTGFTLVEIMLAVAMLGAVSLGVMKLTGNLSSIQTSSRGVVDEADLANLVNLIVTDAMDCKVSLAGNDPVASPVIFQKINIDDIATEGLDVELWVADQAGTARKSKRVSASDANFTKFGALKMDSIKLVLNNGSGTNYTVNPAHSDVGVLRLKYSKALSPGKTKSMVKDFSLRINMSTDASGVSTILGCGSAVGSTSSLCQTASGPCAKWRVVFRPAISLSQITAWAAADNNGCNALRVDTALKDIYEVADVKPTLVAIRHSGPSGCNYNKPGGFNGPPTWYANLSKATGITAGGGGCAAGWGYQECFNIPMTYINDIAWEYQATP